MNMDFSNPDHKRVFFEVHAGLPRQGPGNKKCTARALALNTNLPASPHVLDLACGPGMQTRDLAALMPHAQIKAIDLHEEFIAEAKALLRDDSLARVMFEVGDMAADSEPNDSYDLVWCEGAAYIIGVETALERWRRLLKIGGAIAFTDCCWLKPNPPTELASFWNEYPDMTDAQTRRTQIEDLDYILLGDFVLPANAWLDDYYHPLQQRVTTFRSTHRHDAAANGVLDGIQQEIDLFNRYQDYYGYVFFVVTPAPTAH